MNQPQCFFLLSIKLLITVLQTYFCCRVLLCTCWIPWAGPAVQWCRGTRWRRAPPPRCCTSPPPSAALPGSTSLPPNHTHTFLIRNSVSGSGSFHQRAKKRIRKNLCSTVLYTYSALKPVANYLKFWLVCVQINYDVISCRKLPNLFY